jgi:hypothetical protein
MPRPGAPRADKPLKSARSNLTANAGNPQQRQGVTKYLDPVALAAFESFDFLPMN